MMTLMLPAVGSSLYANFGLTLMCFGGVIGVLQAIGAALLLYALAVLSVGFNGDIPIQGRVFLLSQAGILSYTAFHHFKSATTGCGSFFTSSVQ